MKITILTKHIKTNVIAQTAAEAVRLFETSDEVQDAQVNVVSVTRLVHPEAARQTVRFSNESGIHVLGNFDGLAEHLEENPAAVSVWDVTLQLEYSTEFTPKVQAPNNGETGTIAGSIPRSEPTDPSDRMPAPGDRTEGEL